MTWKKKKDYTVNPIDLSTINVPMKIEQSDLDEWQKEVMQYEGNIAICSGRQVGKSAIMALKAAKTLLKYAGLKVLISSGSERQANYIYEKIKIIFKTLSFDCFANDPTMRLTRLKNGSELYCLPTGQTGDLIRGLTLDIWIPDEAAYINSEVWASVSPMLWIGKDKGMGWIWALSTPAGKIGKFYECFKNENFKKWHISSMDCERIPKEELERWKKEYSSAQYKQEVLGQFVDDIARFFSDELINACVRDEVKKRAYAEKYLGVDVARYGGDLNAFVIAESDDEMYSISYCETTERKGINETFSRILQLDEKTPFNKILIDDAGVGGGLTDFLIEKLGSRVLGVNNAQRIIDSKKKRKKLMKEDLYSVSVMLMEQGKVEIIKNDDLIASLSSVLYEYQQNGDLKIYGRNTHITEALVRAIWGAKKKGLNLWVAY